MTTPTNPNADYAGMNGTLGIAFNRRTNATTETNPQEHMLGSTCMDLRGSKFWVYVKASGAIGSNNNVSINWGPATATATSVASKTTNNYVNGTAAFADADFG